MAVQPDAGQGDEDRLVYDGTTGDLFSLCLRIFLLNLVTLGFYRFWGRTRIRKYLWGHVRLNGDRFAYDGTGGELFVRFLVALAVIVPLFFMAAIASALSGSRAVVIATQATQGLLILYLSFFAHYTSHRYRLSRTTWRGIRGGLDGSANRYALMAFAFLPLQMVTLTLAAPWQFIAMRRYEARNAGFGNDNFRFEGTGRGILKPYLVVWLMMVGLVALPIAAIVFFSGHMVPAAKGGKVLDPALRGLVLALVLFYLVYWLVLFAMSFRYWARAINYALVSLSFHGVRFAGSVRGRRLFRLMFGNILLVIFTLGFAAPFAAQRIMRFYCRNLHLANAKELDTLRQAPGRRQRRGGEGLLQVLDTGGFA